MKTLPARLRTLDIKRAKSLTQVTRIRGNSLQKIRRDHFRENPLCVQCEKEGRISLATELDHIVPIAHGGSESDSNRQGLCRYCHDAKSATEATERTGGGKK